MDHLRVSGVSFLVYGARCLEVLGDFFVLFYFVWTFIVIEMVSWFPNFATSDSIWPRCQHTAICVGAFMRHVYSFVD